MRRSLSALAILAALLVVGRVITPGLRRDVTVRIDLEAWHRRGLRVRSVSLCASRQALTICAVERRVEAIAPVAVVETLRLPGGPLWVEVRVAGETSVEVAGYTIDPETGETNTLRAPEPP